MLQCRKIAQTAKSLRDLLKGTDEEKVLGQLLQDVSEKYENEYQSSKQIEKKPTLVYQMFGKKTTELTPEEARAYKAWLKRIRTQKGKELK